MQLTHRAPTVLYTALIGGASEEQSERNQARESRVGVRRKGDGKVRTPRLGGPALWPVAKPLRTVQC